MNINPNEEINGRAEKITDEDIGNAARQEQKAEQMTMANKILRQYWADIKTTFALLRDWYNGRYRQVPYRMVASLAAAMLYMLSPVDIVPDVIPFAGLIDDALVLAAVFAMSRRDLDAYSRFSKGTQN